MTHRVFIAHSSLDKDFVDELAMNLNRNSISVWYDKWSMRVGESLRQKISEGILDSDFMIVVLSPNSANSPWVAEELNAGVALSMESRSVFVLPLLLSGENTSLPLFLRDKLFADFRKDYSEGFRTLLAAIQGRDFGDGLVRFITRRHSSGWQDVLEKLPERTQTTFKIFCKNMDRFGVAFCSDEFRNLSAYETELAADSSLDFEGLALYGLVAAQISSWTEWSHPIKRVQFGAKLTRLGYMIGKHLDLSGIERVKLELLPEK